MFKLNILFALIAAILLVQTYTTGSGLSFDLRKSNAYLNSGNCYLTIGSSYSGGRIGTRFYNQPFGWRQHRNRLYIPNILRQRGDWSFGLRLSDGSSTANQMFKITINGLQLRISTVYGTGSRNLIIRDNFRSEDSNDDDYQDFINSVNLEDSWFSGPSDSYWWYPSSTVQVQRRSSLNFDVDNLIYDDSNLRNSVIFSTTPSLVSTTTTVRTGIQTASNRVVLDRQITANRQVEQLNSVISQLTSNVQSSSGIVSRSTAELSRLKGAAGECNDKILEFSTKKQTAFTAVSNLRVQISQAKAKLEDFRPALLNLVQKRKELIDERDNIQKSKPSSQTLFKWQAQAAACDDQVERVKTEQAKINRNIDENEDRIDSIRRSTADGPNQISLAKQQLSVVEATIADLENKLANARAQKIKIQSDINGYEQSVRTSKTQISGLESLNIRLKTQSVTLKSRIDSKVIQCDNYDKEVAEIRKQIAEKQQDYQDLVKKITVQDNLIATKRNQMNRFESQISILPIRLGSLEGDLQSAQISLQRQYQICSQSSDAVIRLESDLRSAQLKFETQSKFLNQAKSKLTAARAQKKAADDAVDQYLGNMNRYQTKQSSDLSVSIQGSTNPSGSVQIIRNNPISIGSIGDYVTRIYGPTVREYVSSYTVRPSNLYSTMYPVSSTTLNAIYGRSAAGIFLPQGSGYVLPNFEIGKSSSFSNILGDFSCSTSNDYVSGYGKVVSVQPGYVIISTNSGNQLPLRVSDCSRMESNRPNFVLSTSDNVFYRGRSSSKNDLHLHDLTCLV